MSLQELSSAQILSPPISKKLSNRKKHAIPNPFRIPEDKETFKIHNQMQERPKNIKSSITSTVPVGRKNFRYLTEVEADPITEEQKALDKLIPPPDSSMNREGLHQFISQKREIFLAQLAIDTKREELQRLERLEREEESAIKSKEAEIELFKTMYDKYVESATEVMKAASKKAVEKEKEISVIKNQISQVLAQESSLESEKRALSQKLEECQRFQQFLDSLTPPDWLKKHPGEMYFKEPQQLITIMQSLEEQNMLLIRHCQEVEEKVERYRTQFNELLESRDGEMISMMQNKEEKEKELQYTRDKNEQYKNDGNFRFGNELSEDDYKKLQNEITKFYEALGFDAASSNDVAMMLMRIENRMENLIIKLESIDQQTVKSLAQEKERVRRDEKRSREQEKKARDQADKVKKAIELANKPIERKLGRPLYERVVVKKGHSRQEEEDRARREKAEKEADEQLLFGQIWD